MSYIYLKAYANNITDMVNERITEIVNSNPSQYILHRNDPDYTSLIVEPCSKNHYMTIDEIESMLCFEFLEVRYFEKVYISTHYKVEDDTHLDLIDDVPIENWVNHAAVRYIKNHRKIIGYELQMVGKLRTIISDEELIKWLEGNEKRCLYAELGDPNFTTDLIRIPVEYGIDELYGFLPNKTFGIPWEFIGQYNRLLKKLNF